MSTLQALLAAGPRAFIDRRAQGAVSRAQAGATLSQLFFAGVDLSGFDLSNAELDGCTVSDVDFRGADLRGAFLHDGRFERCDFRAARLAGASLERVQFLDCLFAGAEGLKEVEVGVSVEGFNEPAATTSAAQPEAPRYVPGRVAVNETLERALDEAPDDEQRWAVYGDWLLAEGDVRGELVGRAGQRAAHERFVEEHLEELFPGCSDELRGGGGVPELLVDWAHGLARGLTLQSVNTDRPVELPDLLGRAWPLAVCRFVSCLRFGLNPRLSVDRENDYAPVVEALASSALRARITELEFGLQEPGRGDYEDEHWEPWGDLSALWPAVPQLRRLKVTGQSSDLGQIDLPALTEVVLEIDFLHEPASQQVIAARWPRLERFTLWGRGRLDLEELLASLARCRLTHFGLPFTRQVGQLLPRLVDQPWLPSLRVLDLRQAELRGGDFEVLKRLLPRFAHLERVDLADALDPIEEAALLKVSGPTLILHQEKDSRLLEDNPLDSGEEDFPDFDLDLEQEVEHEIESPAADLDIPDEHDD